MPYLEEFHCLVRQFGTYKPQCLFVKFALQVLLDFFIFKATKLAHRTGELNPGGERNAGVTSLSLARTEMAMGKQFLNQVTRH